MRQLVRYNGRIDRLDVSTGDVSTLVYKKIYIVSGYENHDRYTLVSLKGVLGKFNLLLFDTLEARGNTVPVHTATSRFTPRIDMPYRCTRLVKTPNGLQTREIVIGKVVSLNPIYLDIYEVHSNDAMYIVQVV